MSGMAAMYGGPPGGRGSPRLPKLPPPWDEPKKPDYDPDDGPPPKHAVVQQLMRRIEWLRAQLAKVDDWREELEGLERMLAATALAPPNKPER